MRSAFIEEHRGCWPVKVTCRVLRVSRSGFYAWCRRGPSASARRREALAQRIGEVHGQSRHLYGSPRVRRALVAQGESVCVNTVAKVMKVLHIKAKTAKAFVPRTTDTACHTVAIRRPGPSFWRVELELSSDTETDDTPSPGLDSPPEPIEPPSPFVDVPTE